LAIAHWAAQNTSLMRVPSLNINTSTGVPTAMVLNLQQHQQINRL